jgi:hypothetical protein
MMSKLDNDPNGKGDISDSSSPDKSKQLSMRTKAKNFSREELKIVLDRKIREEKDLTRSKSQGCSIF